MKQIDPTFLFPRLMKPLGLILILFAITGICFLYIKQLDIDYKVPVQIISLGLVFIFFSREKIDDERVHQIKFRSLIVGFVMTYLSLYIIERFLHALSAYEFVAIALSIATIIFHYAKFKL